jgi:serine-type D-Ala-D-Ala carboxypeptidase (penicillin-binding protein 5/6)
VSASSLVIMSEASGRTVYSKQAYDRRAPASTAKLVTALVVLEGLPLDDYVTAPKAVESIEPSKLYVKAGDQLRVRDLLKALLMDSANDVATMLAMAHSGSEDVFSKAMTKKVKSLGGNNTQFKNANGLPVQNQYSCAYDMALVMKEVMKSQVLMSILRQRTTVIRTKNGKRFSLSNHNKMLWRNEVVLGKTGWTRRAKHCFVGMMRGHYGTFIISMLGSSTLWPEVKTLYRAYAGEHPMNQVLQHGAKGKDVQKIQLALRRAGYFAGHATGFFGTKTTKAVSNFQRDEKLSVDGIVGPQTRRALQSY